MAIRDGVVGRGGGEPRSTAIWRGGGSSRTGSARPKRRSAWPGEKSGGQHSRFVFRATAMRRAKEQSPRFDAVRMDTGECSNDQTMKENRRISPNRKWL
jgi:hypothetical protein